MAIIEKYNEKGIKIYHGDCMEAMREMPDKSFELAIVDPPYGIGINSMNMGSRQTIKPDNKKWDKAIPTSEYFFELFRVSKEQIIWGGNYFFLPPSRCYIVWDKGEGMYGRDFAECEQAWVSFDKSARIYKHNPNQLDRIHVTQKPVKLYEWLLTNYAKTGDKILDTHLGSGSSAIACDNLGFELTAYELDEEYVDGAIKRLIEHRQQLKLFTAGLVDDEERGK